MFHKNYQNLKILSFTIGFILILISCKKDDPKPLFSKGIIKGSILIEDSNDSSDIIVKISGPYGDKTTTPIYKNFFSEFKFEEVGNGSYSLSISKKGYGSIKDYAVESSGKDTVFTNYFSLYKMPLNPVILNNLVIANRNDNGISFVIVPFSDRSNQIMFLSTNNDVAYNEYQSYVHVGNYLDNSIYFNLTKTTFKTGTKVYCIIYPLSDSDYTGYINKNGIRIFSTVDPNKHSNVISFIF